MAEKKQPPMLLIDGDQFLYKSAIAVEKETRWDEDNHVLYSNVEECHDTFTRMLNNVVMQIQKHLGCSQITKFNMKIALTKGENFRLGILPTYKGNRAGARKPLCYAEVRDRIESEYTTQSFDGLEADDIMGIWATVGKPGDPKPIIVSDDKDMKTIPGLLWRMGELQHLEPAEADYWHLYQTLIGDTTDGYQGCPGIGPTKAEKILNFNMEEAKALGSIPPEAAGIMWRAIVAAYEKAGLTEADALVQARCARILRNTEWNAKKKEVILWTPN